MNRLLLTLLLLAACGPAAPWPEEPAPICLLVPGDASEVPGVVEGMMLALDEVGGWDSPPGWAPFETGHTAEGALEAFHLCQHRGGRLAVGPVAPGAVRTVLPAAGAHEMVLLVPRLAGPIDRVSGNVLAIEAPVERIGEEVARQIQRRRLERVAVMREPGDYGASLVRGLGELEEDLPLPVGSSADQVPSARELGAAGVEALVLVGSGDLATSIVGLLGERDMAGVHLWLVDWGMQPSTLAAVPAGAADRVHAVAPAPLGEGFRRRYASRFGSQPGAAAGAGHDAVRRAASAAAAVGDGGWEELVSWLRATPDSGSAFGRTSFVDRDGLWVADAAWPIPYEVAIGPSGPYFLPAPDLPDQGPRYDAPSPGGLAP